MEKFRTGINILDPQHGKICSRQKMVSYMALVHVYFTWVSLSEFENIDPVLAKTPVTKR
jgi:hypothetical protein